MIFFGYNSLLFISIGYNMPQRKIVQKARSADTLKLQGYQRELERKISMIHYWVKRWDNTTNDIDTARYNAPILAMRHKLLEKFNKEAKHMDSVSYLL